MENQETNTSMNNNSNQQNPWSIPGAIVFAGLLIAAAVFYGNGGQNNNALNNNQGTTQDQGNSGQNASLDKIDPITSKDHVLGDINAPVKLVEYSDLECPFCKRFHETVQQVMNEYGKDGRVALVYRHFPLDSLHPKARKEAQASECANELGGNDKFWAFINRIFEITPSNNNLDPSQLTETAKYIGLDETAFSTCLASSDKYNSLIETTIADAIETGGQGTPWSIVIAKDGTKYPINGALPYSTIKAVIDQALAKK